MLAKKVQTIINFLTMPICKTFGKILISWCVIKKNQKCVNTPHAKNLQTFFAICYFIGRRAENYQNLTTESGSKQRFSLSKEKVVIQAVCPRTQAVSIKA